MRKTRKITSILVLIAMLFMIAAPAMADTTTPDGSVTVTNAKDGQTYKLFKLFDATMGANDAITYTLPQGKTEADLVYIDSTGTTHQWFKVNDNGFVEKYDDTVTVNWAKDPNAIAWAKSFGTQVGSAVTKDGDTTVSWTNINYGYYFVETTLGSFISVDSANKNARIEDKNEGPRLDKEITGVNNETTTLGVGDETTDPGEGANEKAIAEVGDTVSYKLTIYAKPGAENYKVTDVLTHLQLVASSVKVNDVAYGESTIVDKANSSVENNASEFTIAFTKAYLDTIKNTDATITIEYDAIITGDATIGATGNDNTATLTYGHKDTPDSDSDSAKVYTGKVSVVKNDEANAGLAGAVFALKNNSDQYYKIDATTKVVTWVDSVDEATKYTSGVDGKLDGEFTGLSNGSYTLEEVTAPDGYNKIDANDESLKFTIADRDYTDVNLIQSKTVINKKGAVLPSTGGIGTTIFYVAGAALAVGAGVLLVTRRRMDSQR